jgi:hypothetical protein
MAGRQETFHPDRDARRLPRGGQDQQKRPRGESPGAFSSTPDRIRTCDLCLRRAALYPAELRAHPRLQPRAPTTDARNKPSSVRRRSGGRVIYLGPTLLTASCGLPRTQAERAAPHPLFGLAPSGVYHATPVSGGPVRSYRTFSPLPVPPKGPSAVRFLRHFPSPVETDARGLPGTLPCGARTFLHRTPKDPTATLTSHILMSVVYRHRCSRTTALGRVSMPPERLQNVQKTPAVISLSERVTTW